MEKIFFVRHQAHGVVDEFPFKEHPTEKQVELVAKYCNQIHGFSHKKTPGEPFWTLVIERTVLGPGELPSVPDRVLTPAGPPGAAATSTSGTLATGTGRITEGKK